MSIKRFACHYFTPIQKDVISALKRVENGVIQRHKFTSEMKALARKEMDCLAAELASLRANGGEASPALATLLKNTSDYDEAENSIRRYGLPSTEEAVIEKFIRSVYPKTVVVKYSALVSAFPYAPKDDPYSYLGWLKFNTQKNCHPQKHGGIMVVEESNGERLIEFWKQGRLIQRLILSKMGIIKEGDVSDFIDAVFAYAEGLELGDIDDAKKSAHGENAFSCIEDILGFPLLLDTLTDFPAGCTLVDETCLMRIFKKC